MVLLSPPSPDPNPICPNKLKTQKSFITSPRLRISVSSTSSSSSSFSLSSWTATEISEAVNGKIVKWGPSGAISIDTRILNSFSSPSWFLALVGQNFDGHDFITPELFTNGCVGVIGQRVCENWNSGFIKPNDEDENSSVIALKKLSIYARRNRFHGGHVIGVTGSVGKTTTRRMISLVLVSSGLVVHETCGNQNNVIGVGMNLVGIPRNADVVVLELGMSGKGEILELTRMCEATVRVVLNVGPSHLENFDDDDDDGDYARLLERVASAKGEILSEAKDGDVCVLNADDPLVMGLHVPNGVKKVLFGQRMGCDVRLVHSEVTDGGHGVLIVLERNMEMVEFVIPSPGMHLALNACAAATVAVLLGVSLPQVALALSRYNPVRMRSELEIAENGITIINDAYNANPTSMKAGINLLKTMDCGGKRVAILGDMLELGRMETTAHKMVLSLCNDDRIGLVALVGKRFLAAAEALNICGMMNIICTIDAEALALKIAGSLSSNDAVLVKGSRGMQMEKVVDAIKAAH